MIDGDGIRRIRRRAAETGAASDLVVLSHFRARPGIVRPPRTRHLPLCYSPFAMNHRTRSRIVEQLAGDGWLLSGGVRLGQVTYAIDVQEVRTSRGPGVVAGTELRVRLVYHSIDVERWQGQLLTLALHDDRRITGFISTDGEYLIRTGALA